MSAIDVDTLEVVLDVGDDDVNDVSASYRRDSATVVDG